MAVPDRRREACDIDVAPDHRVFEERGGFDGNGRLRRQILALLHPGFQRVERSQPGIEPERQRGALHIGGRIGEDAKAGAESL